MPYVCSIYILYPRIGRLGTGRGAGWCILRTLAVKEINGTGKKDYYLVYQVNLEVR